MTEEYETYAYFRVLGFEGPYSEITDLLGLEPTEAWKKGDRDNYLQSKKESVWEYHSPLPKNEIFIDAHILSLINILETKAEQIKQLPNKYDVGINCVGYFTCANPGFHLDSKLLKRCAALNLSIDFDLYCREG